MLKSKAKLIQAHLSKMIGVSKQYLVVVEYRKCLGLLFSFVA